jgi:hypothetical protein
MRKALYISLLSLLILAFTIYGGGVKAHMGPGMMGGGGSGGWYCPYCGHPMGPGGGHGMGHGMMDPGMMGPGMMGPGMMGPEMGLGMMGPGYRGYEPQYAPSYGPQYQQSPKPLGDKDAKAMLENYIQSTRNPNLKLGKITEKDNYFEAEILTKENSLVDKILVDKFTGWMRSTY